MKTYRDGDRSAGRNGRTYEESEPVFPFPVAPEAPPYAPNILYVVIDDIGFGAIDAFGGLIETPNISRLASRGLRYTNFHTTALCSPTRACLLTGRNHHSVGMGTTTETATGFPGYNGRQPMNKAAIAAMLRQHGYASFAVGKWHNTPSEETSPTGPFDRWPDGPLFGFDRFYGFMAGDDNPWFPKLFEGRKPIDQAFLPSEGYHLSEDLAEKVIENISVHQALEADKPWLGYLAFGACHAPHHVWKSWVERYRGKFDMGWDEYRRQTLERQKQMGLVPPHTKLAPVLESVPAWDALSADQKKVCARMMETYAGFTSHADEQIGRVLDFLEATGALDNTLVFVFVGDNGASGEGTLHGIFNEMTLMTVDPLDVESVELNLARIDQLGEPSSYNHYPLGWALAMNTPFKLCKQDTRFGGTRNPLVVHWPKGFKARGELRNQFHHVIDIVPTILAAVGVEAPRVLDSQQQEPLEGVPMNYTFDQPRAATTHPTQYFEVLGNRAIVDGTLKAVSYHGRKPWENRAAWSFDDDHWELYDLEADPSECHDLMRGLDFKDRKQPTVRRLMQLVGLWWSEAGRYGVLPLEDRLQDRLVDRAEREHHTRTKFTFRPGAVRIPKDAAPDPLNRSWTATAAVNVPTPACEGPIVAMNGDAAGWSLYLKKGIPTFCYNFAGVERTYIRSEQQLAPGPHLIRYEFESLPEHSAGAGQPEAHGARGVGRIYVDKRKVAEGEIPRTMAFDCTLDETLDIGCDKGSPVTDEYAPLAAFNGRIAHVTIDIDPDVAFEVDRDTTTHAQPAMIRQ